MHTQASFVINFVHFTGLSQGHFVNQYSRDFHHHTRSEVCHRHRHGEGQSIQPTHCCGDAVCAASVQSPGVCSHALVCVCVCVCVCVL